MMTELSVAASSGKVAAVRKLISQGADVNEQNNHGYTALMAAATAGYSQIVQLLIDEGTDVSLTDSIGTTALVNPCLNERMVELLKPANQFHLRSRESWLESVDGGK